MIILGEDEESGEDREVLAIVVEEGNEEEVLDCKVMGLCSIAGSGVDRDPSRTMKLVGKA